MEIFYGKPPLTLQERQEIERLVQLNRSIGEIASALNRPTSTISRELNKLISRKEYNAEKMHALSQGGKGKAGRLLEEERVQIEDLLARKFTVNRIASILRRSYCCIKQEVQKNGGKDNYTASAAQAAFVSRVTATVSQSYKHFSEEQLKIIEQGIEEEWSKSQIAKKAGVSSSTISAYFHRNHTPYKPRHITALYQRVKLLETQMEILINETRRINERLSKN